MPNFNLDDPNNPLNALLAGRPIFGRAGWMPFGADGMNLAGSLHDASSYRDPRYWEQYSEWDGDAGQRTCWRPRADVQQRLAGREQLANTNIGGPAEAIDPSQVQYDEEFGLLTGRDNIRDTIRSRQAMTGILALAAPAAIGAMGAMSGMGAGAGEAGAGWSATGTGTAGVGAGATGVGAVDMGAFGTAGAASSGLTGNSMVDGLLNNAMRNPLQTFGLIRTVSGMFGGNGNGNSGNSSGQQKGGNGEGVGNPGAFQQAPYQPNPITAAQIQNMRFARPRGY